MNIGKDKRKYRMFNLKINGNQMMIEPPRVVKRNGNTAEISGERGIKLLLTTGMKVRILTTTMVSGRKEPVRYTYTIGEVVVGEDDSIGIRVPEDQILADGKEYQILIPEEAVVNGPALIDWSFLKQ